MLVDSLSIYVIKKTDKLHEDSIKNVEEYRLKSKLKNGNFLFI